MQDLPEPILPKNIAVSNLDEFLQDQSAIFEMDPQEMARQITILDADIYRSIRPKECLNQGWEKSDKIERSPNISRIIQQTNNVHHYFHYRS
jgi:hypothetical protein